MSVRAAVSNLAPGKRTLAQPASHYLCRVLRLTAGDRFVAFDPEAKVEAEGIVEHASGEAAEISVGELRPAGAVAPAPLVVVYGFAKGDKVDSVVRDATELGATRIIIAQTARSVARAEGARSSTKLERWKRIVEQAARQCGRADPPAIDAIVSWDEALAIAARETTTRFCLWERATDPLGEVLPVAVARGDAIAFAIGPEGGLADSEVERAVAEGFSSVSLGPFILRTETVAAAVLGAVRILTRRP